MERRCRTAHRADSFPVATPSRLQCYAGRNKRYTPTPGVWEAVYLDGRYGIYPVDSFWRHTACGGGGYPTRVVAFRSFRPVWGV